MKLSMRRLALFLLTAILAMQLLLTVAMGEETQQEVTHIATSTVALKVRVEPEQDARGIDSIPKGAYVYILELGDDFCKVETSGRVGYILSKYLIDIREYPFVEGVSSTVELAQEDVVVDLDGFGSKETFEENYYAYSNWDTVVYDSPDERSYVLVDFPAYKQAVVSEIQGNWAYLCYKGQYGYTRVDKLFKWDRINPYIGEIPGLVVYPQIVYTNKSTNIYSVEDNSVLYSVNPGAALTTNEMDELGRYTLPYWRTTGYVNAEDVAYTVPVVAWDEAQAGDLISTMSTYYALGISTLQIQGRNWNIRLSASMITGTVLQPGEKYDMNGTIAPYKQSTGYHKAPIMSKSALWGYGGGTCQVNTTFYMSTIQVPLRVTHRRVHAEVGIYYAPVGFDAAVGGGEINLRMTNTLPYPVRYHVVMSDGVITALIYRES
ncbi:MAG: SH3 domain-containing protein [Clostridiales bacterium]|nr:SH3 domain-containing protein [Clostridiales bacterium]